MYTVIDVAHASYWRYTIYHHVQLPKHTTSHISAASQTSDRMLKVGHFHLGEMEAHPYRGCLRYLRSLKRTASMDFWLQVFVMNNLPPSPLSILWHHFDFFQEFAKMFTTQCGGRTRSKKSHDTIPFRWWDRLELFLAWGQCWRLDGWRIIHIHKGEDIDGGRILWSLKGHSYAIFTPVNNTGR